MGVQAVEVLAPPTAVPPVNDAEKGNIHWGKNMQRWRNDNIDIAKGSWLVFVLFLFCFVFFASVSPLLLQSLSGAGGGVTFCPFRCYHRCHKQIDPLHLSSSSVRIRNVASTTNRPVEQLRLTGHDVDVLVQCVHLFPPSFFFVALLLLLLVFFRVFYWMVFISPLFYGRHHYRYCSCAAVAFGSPIGRSANVRPIRCQSLCGSSNPVRVFWLDAIQREHRH